MPGANDDFPRSVRGYDREAVDKAVAKLRRELMTTKTLFDEQSERVRDLESIIADLRHDVEHMSRPTASTLNSRMQRLLREAERKASEIVDRATAEAERMRRVSERDRQRVETELNLRLANERSAAISEAHILISGAKNSAERIVDEATRRARRTIEESEREAGEVRGAAATETARLRASARHEAEEIVAEAQRQADEMKLRILNELPEGKATKLGKELTAMLKLETEISVRRDEAEKAYLSKHNEAVLATQKYLDEAEAQLKLMRANAREAELSALTILARAEREAIDVVAEASAQVESLVANARDEAVRIIDAAETESASVLADADERSQQLLMQREAINSFVIKMNVESEKIATREQ